MLEYHVTRSLQAISANPAQPAGCSILGSNGTPDIDSSIGPWKLCGEMYQVSVRMKSMYPKLFNLQAPFPAFPGYSLWLRSSARAISTACDLETREGCAPGPKAAVLIQTVTPHRSETGQMFVVVLIQRNLACHTIEILPGSAWRAPAFIFSGLESYLYDMHMYLCTTLNGDLNLHCRCFSASRVLSSCRCVHSQWVLTTRLGSLFLHSLADDETQSSLQRESASSSP